MTGPRRRALIALGVLAFLRVGWRPAEQWCACTSVACWAAALALAGAGALLVIGARAGWLAARAARALAAVPLAAVPRELAEAAARTGVSGVRAVHTAGVCAFCTGLWRPRIYVSADTAAILAPDEIDAVLVHEAAHARRRDPLRRVLWQAAADVLAHIPLAAWCAERHCERAELAADRSAIDRVGRRAVARALLAADQQPRATPLAATGFDGAAEARTAQLLGDGPPPRRPAPTAIIISLTGIAVSVSLAVCTGQGLWAVLVR